MKYDHSMTGKQIFRVNHTRTMCSAMSMSRRTKLTLDPFPP